MSRFLFMRIALASACVAMLTGGCAHSFRHSRPVSIRPIAPSTPSGSAPAFANATFYGAAVKAIEARDYGRALDMLQSANTQAPRNIAVLNAFGVVYDKLGRFDLSARYYAQARDLDPNSGIVGRNMAYSDRLQGKSNLTSADNWLAAALNLPELAITPSAAKAQPPYELALATAPTPFQVIRVADSGVAPTERGLRIVDASGTEGRAEQVRLALIRRGWSANPVHATRSGGQPATTIVYPGQSLVIAQALQRTLPFQAKLTACEAGCETVTLVIGADMARTWKGTWS